MNITGAPTVTVTFVAWQRPRALLEGIESCRRQNYPSLEILVLDNSPTDAIHRWLLAEHPDVRTIKTARPIPLPAARNLLVATARGEIVFFHDDDSCFSSPEDVDRAVTYLSEHPTVGCLAFRVADGEGTINPQFDAPAPCATYGYVACAAAFRREAFARAGWYFEKFPLYGEERVLSLGLFGAGFDIHLLPTVTIIHRMQSDGRVRDNAARYHLADIVMVPGAAVLRFPFPAVMVWYPVMLSFYFAQAAIVRRRPWVALRGLLSALAHLPDFLRERTPLPQSEFDRWKAVRTAFNLAYLQRTRRWRWFHRYLPATG